MVATPQVFTDSVNKQPKMNEKSRALIREIKFDSITLNTETPDPAISSGDRYLLTILDLNPGKTLT